MKEVQARRRVQAEVHHRGQAEELGSRLEKAGDRMTEVDVSQPEVGIERGHRRRAEASKKEEGRLTEVASVDIAWVRLGRVGFVGFVKEVDSFVEGDQKEHRRQPLEVGRRLVDGAEFGRD